MTEEAIWWATPQEGGGYVVDVPKLLFAITTRELVCVDLLHIETKDGRRLTRDENIEVWKAMIQNLRLIDKMTCVRAAYYQFFNERGSTRDTYPARWKAAWDYINFLFTVDLDRVWDDPYYGIEDLRPDPESLIISNTGKEASHED